MNSPPSHPQLNQPADYEGTIMTQKIIDVSEVEALRTYGDLDDMIMRHHLLDVLDKAPSVSAPTIPEGYITKVVEMCAKIAEKYEPEEKQSYIDYASKEIRRTLPAIISANQGSDKARE